MPFLRKFQIPIKIAALVATLIFLPVSLGLPLHRLLQARSLFLWLPPYFIAPSMLVLAMLGVAPKAVCLLLAAGMLSVVAAWPLIGRRWLRVFLAAGLMAMIAFPFVYRYQPAVLAAPGHDLILVTAPDSFCGQVRRQSESWWEIRRCEYELIGWDEDETLFYREQCDELPEQLWAYNPNRRTSPEPVEALPETLYPQVSDPNAIDYVWADAYPPSAEESVRAISFPRPWVISPTGRWVAAVARHVYGPEDVIIVSTSGR